VVEGDDGLIIIDTMSGVEPARQAWTSSVRTSPTNGWPR
jgi:hypothetical protein